MFYVANLETRRILTYREGDRILCSNEETAKQMAIMCQELTGHPAAVLHMTETHVDSLGREVAPWLKIQRKIVGADQS